MSKSLFLSLCAVAALTAYATGLGLKAGLYEIKIVKQVIDGRDMTAQMAAASEKMQQAMANMPPEQRARMQAMMPNAGGGDSGGYRICISPEMAKRDTPVVDKEGHCQPATINRAGNVTTYEFHCTSTDGSTRDGKGESTAGGDVISNRFDMTSHTANGQSHIMHSETEMHYLGADCGSVKPIEPPK